MPRGGTQLEYKGETFTSIGALAKSAGVASSTLCVKLREGMSIEKAVQACKSSKCKRGYDYEGVHYSSLDALAEAYDINECTLKTRIYKLKMSLEDAIKAGRT